MLVELGDIIGLEQGAALYGGEELSGKYWIFDTVSGRHFRLNEIGYFALSLLDAERTVEEILVKCFSKYAVSKGDLERDVLSFLEDCLEKGILARKKSAEDIGIGD